MKEKLTAIDLRPLPSTYVTALESANREKWFIDFKYPILDALTFKEEGENETKKLDFKDIESAIKFFTRILEDVPAGLINGVRVYFASPSIDGTVTTGKCGKLTLIFVATAGISGADVASAYYSFKDGDFVPIAEDLAREWVHNYQNIKRPMLFKTLSDQDITDRSKETKHIYFSYDQFNDTLEEMVYQNKNHGNIVKGFGIRFTSYTNQNYQVGHSKPIKHRRRMTIGFTFIDNNGNDIGIQDINPIEFNERVAIKFVDDTMDSGDPTPPPPTNNGENLDVGPE